jgi:hypothetical protein
MAWPPNFAHLYYDIFYEPKKPNLTYVTRKPMSKAEPTAAVKLVKNPYRKYVIGRARKTSNESADAIIEDRIKSIEQTLIELTTKKTIEQAAEERMVEVNEKLDELQAKRVTRTCSIKTIEVSAIGPQPENKHSAEAPKMPAFEWEREKDKGAKEDKGDAGEAMLTREWTAAPPPSVKADMEAEDERRKNLVFDWQLNNLKNMQAWRAARAGEKEGRSAIPRAGDKNEEKEECVDTVTPPREEWPEPMLHNLSQKEQKRLKKLALQHEPRSVMNVGTAKAQLAMMNREMRSLM